MNIKVKKLHPNAELPEIMRSGDAGADLTAISVSHNDMYSEYGTGLSVQIPEGYVGLLFPRSSLSNYDLVLANSVGVIDSNFRGEIKLRFKKANLRDTHDWNTKEYKVRDRVGQLVIVEIPKVEYEEVEELDNTSRGSDGFGSSGT